MPSALAGGRGFVSDQYSATVTVFDLATLMPVRSIETGYFPEGVAASADGRFVYVANWESNTLSVIDAEKLAVVAEIEVGDGPRAFGAFIRSKP
jgi:YVTN family beta-propeller protein